MRNDFSTAWKSSTQPRKQRKYIANAPFHIKRKFLAAPLSKELRKKYGTRSLAIRKEDKVKILRGQFRKKESKVVSIDLKKIKINLEEAFIAKKDGSKAFYPIHPSNVVITDLNLDDKERKKSLDRIKNDASKKIKSS